eukprot:2029427-Pleurochrysis_carterae.AAC.1
MAMCEERLQHALGRVWKKVPRTRAQAAQLVTYAQETCALQAWVRCLRCVGAIASKTTRMHVVC